MMRILLISVLLASFFVLPQSAMAGLNNGWGAPNLDTVEIPEDGAFHFRAFYMEDRGGATNYPSDLFESLEIDDVEDLFSALDVTVFDPSGAQITGELQGQLLSDSYYTIEALVSFVPDEPLLADATYTLHFQGWVFNQQRPETFLPFAETEVAFNVVDGARALTALQSESSIQKAIEYRETCCAVPGCTDASEDCTYCASLPHYGLAHLNLTFSAAPETLPESQIIFRVLDGLSVPPTRWYWAGEHGPLRKRLSPDTASPFCVTVLAQSLLDLSEVEFLHCIDWAADVEFGLMPSDATEYFEQVCEDNDEVDEQENDDETAEENENTSEDEEDQADPEPGELGADDDDGAGCATTPGHSPGVWSILLFALLALRIRTRATQRFTKE